jgi:hypothetical protein
MLKTRLVLWRKLLCFVSWNVRKCQDLVFTCGMLLYCIVGLLSTPGLNWGFGEPYCGGMGL